jgi:predicted PurR-regulated permease PerM
MSQAIGRRRSWRRPLFLGLSAALAVTVVIAARAVMMPFIFAALIAYVLTPLVARAERRGMHRGAAVLLAYLVVFGSLTGFGILIAPRIAVEFRNLRRELPALTHLATSTWVPAITDRMRAMGLAPPAPEDNDAPDNAPTSAFVARPLPDGTIAIDVGNGLSVTETKGGWLVEPARVRKEAPFDPNRLIADAIGRTFAYAQRNSLEVARAVRDLVATVSRTIFIFFITLMLAASMILTREKIYGFFRSLLRPEARASFDALFVRIDHGLAGVIRGQLLICLINGALSAVGFAIVGLKYWPVMALIAGLFSLVPIFGSVVSAIPAVVVGLTQGIGTAVFVLAWIVGIHQLEGNLLNPKIMGDSAKLHPVLVIFALLVGEHFFRAVGAILAVPVMSIAQSVFLHLEHEIDRDEGVIAGDTPR